MNNPEKLKIKVLVILLLLALACVFILVLILLGPRVSTKPYSKFVLIGGSVLFLALGILCIRISREGIIFGVLIIVSAVFMLILGLLV